MLRLYGTPRSRANRCLWMLEEMGHPYEFVEKSAHEYLRLMMPHSRYSREWRLMRQAML